MVKTCEYTGPYNVKQKIGIISIAKYEFIAKNDPKDNKIDSSHFTFPRAQKCSNEDMAVYSW